MNFWERRAADARAVWRGILDWFEHGDLVPPLVVASAWHYVQALAGRDPVFSAVPIALLVDLGHYRTVRIAARYRIDNRRKGRARRAQLTQAVLRWSIALIMTAISLAYHITYYGWIWPDALFAVPFPVLIAALAYFAQVDRRNAGTAPAMRRNAAHDVEEEPAGRRNGKHGAWRTLALRLQQEHPEWTQRRIAEACGVDPSRVSRVLPKKQEVDHA